MLLIYLVLIFDKYSTEMTHVLTLRPYTMNCKPTTTLQIIVMRIRLEKVEVVDCGVKARGAIAKVFVVEDNPQL